jgi:hypothetical protein
MHGLLDLTSGQIWLLMATLSMTSPPGENIRGIVVYTRVSSEQSCEAAKPAFDKFVRGGADAIKWAGEGKQLNVTLTCVPPAFGGK